MESLADLIAHKITPETHHDRAPILRDIPGGKPGSQPRPQASAADRATISYQDSQAATTTFFVLKRALGYFIGHRCAAGRARKQPTALHPL